MSTEYYNSQWQMPNEANKGKRANYSLDLASSRFIDCGTDLWDQLKTGNSISVSWWHKSDGGGDVIPFNFRPAFSGSSINMRFTMYWSAGGGTASNNWNLKGTGIGTQVVGVQPKLPASGWNHYTLSLELGSDTSKQVFYLNGQQIGTTTTAVTSVDQGTNHLYLSQYYSSTYTGTSGTYSSIAFFNYPLSQGQVTTLWGGGTSVSNPMDLSPAPKAYYKLSDSVWDGSEYITANNAVQDYVFDNIVSSAINTPYNLTATSNITVSIWFKTTTNAQSNKYLFSYGNAVSIYDLRLNGTDAVQPIIKIAGVQRAPNISFNYADGNWHQYIVNYDGSNIKVYIDGILKNKSSYSGNLSVDSNNFVFANLTTTVGVTGEVSNCTIHTATLTDGNVSQGSAATGEIATFYNYGSPIKTLSSIPQNSDLKVWYKLDASEIYNSSITDWEVNQASSFWKNSLDFNLTYSSANKAYIQCANTTNLNLTGAMTLSAWMKGDQLGGGNYNGLGTQGGGSSRGYGLLRGTNNAFFSISDNGSSHRYVSSPADTWLDGWNHIVGVFDPNSRFEVYVNGVFSASGTNYAQQTSTNPFQIGNRGDSSHYYNWLGQLSNVSIWNTALSNGSASVGSVAGGEIATLYNNGEPLQDLLTGPQNSNLLSWWKLDNITTGIQDSKGTNNGTIVTLGNGLVNKFDQSVSTLNGTSSGMNQSNLIQSDLQTVAPYSKYAMSFNGTDYIDCGTSQLLDFNSSFTISAWVYMTGVTGYDVILTFKGNSNSFVLSRNASNQGVYAGTIFGIADHPQPMIKSGQDITNNKWNHLVIVYNGNGITSENNYTFYIDNSSQTLTNTGANGYTDYGNVNNIGRYDTNYFTGNLSNVAIWNYGLNASQVKEIYNEGLPSDLNSFSGTAPVAWWQLGEGVSYDGTSLIVQDYKGSNHGTSSSSMDQTDIVNGVGTSLNGVGSGFNAPSTTVTNIVTNAPYSDKNAVSYNMQSAKSGSGIDTSTPQAT